MTRYFFDTLDGGRDRDDIGYEFASMKEVQEEAVLALVDMGKEELHRIVHGGKVSVKVRDNTGKTVLTASLVLDIQRAE